MGTEQEGQDVLDAADEAVQAKDFETAHAVYSKALDRDPQNLRARTGLALVAIRKGSLDDALVHLSAAIAAEPHNRDLAQWIVQMIAAQGDDPVPPLERLLERNPGSSATALALVDLSLEQKNSTRAQHWLEYLSRLDAPTADAWINRALARSRGGDVRSAIRDYDGAVAVSPSSPVTYAYRGNAYFALGEYAAAVADFRKFSELAPDSSFGERRCGDAYTAMEDPANAEASYAEALRRNPDDPEAHLGLGLVYEKQGKLVEARAEYQHVVRLAPESPIGYANRGDTEFALAEYGEAINDYRRVAELAPDSSIGPRRMGDVYSTMNDAMRAVEAYQQALARDPDDVDGHNGLGLVHEGQQKYADALVEYNHVVELAPKNPIGYRNRGDVYVALKQYDAALRDFRRVTELTPESSLGPRLTADVYAEMGDHVRALASYAEALAHDPDDPDAHNGCGLAYEALGDYRKALAEYDRVVELAPDSPVGFANRGTVHFGLDEYDAALENFRRVVELSPESTFGYRRCGDVELARKEPKNALSWYEQALARDEKDADVHNGLGLAKEALEMLREALTHYEQAARLRPDPVFHTNRGAVLVGLRAYDWAVDAYDAALQLDASNLTAYQGKADALRLWANTVDMPDRLRQALETVTRALELDPKDATTQAVLGTVLAKLERHTEALAAFDEALRLDNSYGWAQMEKAKVLYDQGDLEAALRELRALSDTSPEFRGDALTGQALLLRKLGRSADANDALSKALGSYGDANAHLRQARSFVEFHAWEDARTSFRAAIEMTPSLADAHNELAWYQATELRRDLEECTVHALLAVEFAADSPVRGNYLDTLGWVWHLRGDRAEAEEYLTEAVRLVEHDVLIRHHLRVVTVVRPTATSLS